MALSEAALDFAREVLKPGGTFLAKVLRGGTETELLAGMKREFASVRHTKPKASRGDSAGTLCPWYRIPRRMMGRIKSSHDDMLSE